MHLYEYKGKSSYIDCASHRAISLISLGSKVYAYYISEKNAREFQKAVVRGPRRL